MLLETTSKFKASTEEQAKNMIEEYRADAAKKGYSLKKASFEHKTKKAKGEIVDEAWVVSITQIFGSLWEENE